MKGYVVGNIQITDPANYPAYMKRAQEIIAAHGGRYLVRGGDHKVLEGDWQPNRMVVLEFPSREAAEKFYFSPEYQEAAAMRQAASTGWLVLVNGTP